MDYFIDYQKKDFHMLKLKTVTNPINTSDNIKNNSSSFFTVKAI